MLGGTGFLQRGIAGDDVRRESWTMNYQNYESPYSSCVVDALAQKEGCFVLFVYKVQVCRHFLGSLI